MPVHCSTLSDQPPREYKKKRGRKIVTILTIGFIAACVPLLPRTASNLSGVQESQQRYVDLGSCSNSGVEDVGAAALYSRSPAASDLGRPAAVAACHPQVSWFSHRLLQGTATEVFLSSRSGKTFLLTLHHFTLLFTYSCITLLSLVLSLFLPLI